MGPFRPSTNLFLEILQQKRPRQQLVAFVNIHFFESWSHIARGSLRRQVADVNASYPSNPDERRILQLLEGHFSSRKVDFTQ
jgi:predicted deacylase